VSSKPHWTPNTLKYKESLVHNLVYMKKKKKREREREEEEYEEGTR
jgi:hypothetical protein